MKFKSILFSLLASVVGLSAFGGRANYAQPNYDKGKIAPYTLEDPLTFVDGTKVKTPADWERRRQEILDIFAKNMFGQPPPAPEAVVFEKFDEGVMIGGFGIRRQYRMWFKKDKTGPSIDWLVLSPRYAKKPATPILFLNYSGNHELIRDPKVSIPKMWRLFHAQYKPEELRGIYDGHHADKKDINPAEFMFPADGLLARGYAVVTACYAQVSPDAARPTKDPATGETMTAWQGVFDLWPARDPKRTDNTTSIGAWAWALSRGLDLVEQIPGLDAKHAIAAGYSRLGKTALVAAARDTRFAACVPNQTGGGGCPLLKRNYGENVEALMRNFPHWFCSDFGKYAGREKEMPFDSHLLMACIAPRKLLVEGFDDPFYDTEGEFEALKAASPVWTFLGREGLPRTTWPKAYDTSAIGKSVGYVRRSERHGLSAHDWTWIMDFASDKQGGRK